MLTSGDLGSIVMRVAIALSVAMFALGMLAGWIVWG